MEWTGLRIEAMGCRCSLRCLVTLACGDVRLDDLFALLYVGMYCGMMRWNVPCHPGISSSGTLRPKILFYEMVDLSCAIPSHSSFFNISFWNILSYYVFSRSTCSPTTSYPATSDRLSLFPLFSRTPRNRSRKQGRRTSSRLKPPSSLFTSAWMACGGHLCN